MKAMRFFETSGITQRSSVTSRNTGILDYTAVKTKKSRKMRFTAIQNKWQNYPFLSAGLQRF
jgi:hypothetical protein